MKQRILTAVIGLILFIPLVIYGDWPFLLMVYLLASVAFFELLRMKKINLISFPSLFGLLILWLILWQDHLLTWANFLVLDRIELGFIFVLLLLAYTVIVKNRFTFDDVSFILLSALYIGIGFYYFAETRFEGIEYVFYALIVIWLTDSGAYFTGRSLGKHKLWPSISPKKTIEGSVGGILAAIVAALILQSIVEIHTN